MMSRVSSREFTAYRCWVLSRLSRLLCGDPIFWDGFARKRSGLRSGPEPISERFSWEQPFLARPAEEGFISRRKLAVGYGVSGDRLRRYERADILPPQRGSHPDASCSPQHVKRLQWVLFFHRELGMSTLCMAAVLSLEGVRDRFEALVASAPPHVPVHRSRPPYSPEGEKGVDSSKGIPLPASRSLRDLLHDMGNKLHVISGRTERLRRKFPGNDLVERNTAIILAESREAASTLDRCRDMITTHPTWSPQREKGA